MQHKKVKTKIKIGCFQIGKSQPLCFKFLKKSFNAFLPFPLIKLSEKENMFVFGITGCTKKIHYISLSRNYIYIEEY